MNKTTFKKNLPWGLMVFLAIVVTIIALAPYITFNSENFNNATVRYATESTLRYVGLFVHAFSSAIALLIGPFQFLDGFRKRRPMIHRWMGRIYLVSILIGGLSAFIIAPGMISGLVGEVGLMSLAVLWLWTGWNAYSSIRKGDVKSHREWMTRSFALTFAAVMLRLWLGTLIATQLPFLQTKYAGDFDALFVEAYRVVMWLCWVPNIIIAEMIIQRRRSPKVVSSTGQNNIQTQNI
jgi:uncharacterized membrane protein